MENKRPVESSATVDTGLPVAPALELTLEAENLPVRTSPVDGRVVLICVLGLALGVASSIVAQILVHMIALITNIAYFQRWSFESPSFVGMHLPLWVIGVPVIGGLFVGLMARFGSKAIRGHGIPEAMEQVLTNQSRIPARVTLVSGLPSGRAVCGKAARTDLCGRIRMAELLDHPHD